MAQAQPSKDWREKYLDLVESQESQQQQFDDQLEQMRRALVRVSLAADGVDPELDSVLAALREHLKSPDKQHLLYKRLAVVEEAVIAFDERKSIHLSRLRQVLEGLITPVLDLNISRPVNKACKTLKKSLSKRLDNQQELPAILQELADIQQTLLQTDSAEKQSFVQKFLGGRSASTAEKAEATADYESPLQSPSQSPAEPPASIEQSPVALLGELSLVIRDIVDLIEPGSKQNQLVATLREVLENQVSKDTIIQALEQVRELIRETVTKNKTEFGEFLLKTNNELTGIAKILGNVAQAADEQHTQQQQLRDSMNDQLQSLQHSVDDAEELDQLKQQVNSQLETIREKIAQYDKKPSTLSDQLKQLLNQVERFEKDAIKTAQHLSEQQLKAQRDALTGLFNREAYDERCKAEKARWQRYENPLSIAVLDIDLFKKINDTYGHQSGDKVLRLIAQTIQKRLRDVDFVARYGGEEFVVILPETNAKTAQTVLDKLRNTIANTPFHFRKQPVQITLSVGITEFAEADTEVTAFARADKALYKSKNNGRNCTTVL